MVTAGRRKPGVLTGRLSRSAVLTLLALGSQLGCTREFYREWANQDASEAVFEKSRDPRWRLDAFSIEPPAMSRFADPYDQDFPPAPPDDPAAEALSPVPQWPDNRLIVPVEGKRIHDDDGTLETRSEMQAEAEAQPAGNVPGTAAGTALRPVRRCTSHTILGAVSVCARGRRPPRPPAAGDRPAPTAVHRHLAVRRHRKTRHRSRLPPSGPGSSATRNPGANSGTNAEGSTPILVADERSGKTKAAIPPPRPASSFTPRENSRAKGVTDGAVQRTSQQACRRPSGEPSLARFRARHPAVLTSCQDGQSFPLIQASRNLAWRIRCVSAMNQIIPAGPGGVFNRNRPPSWRRVLVPAMLPWITPGPSGCRGSRPYVVTMQQAFTLALINARIYQLQLENLYSAALDVTLQRFAVRAAVLRGHVAPDVSARGRRCLVSRCDPAQSVHSTRRGRARRPGFTLQLGEIAGYGKLLNSGGQLLMGFANQIVFNFVGKNPIQPTVQSSLPLSFVQPFLRGGGRAVVLETLTQAERSLLYQARIFAKFRQEFIVDHVDGRYDPELRRRVSTSSGFSTGGNTDPTVGFIPVAAKHRRGDHRPQERGLLRAACRTLRAAHRGRIVGLVAASG